MENIKYYIGDIEHSDKKFMVAYRNVEKTSLNGYSGLEMIEMFKEAGEIPENLYISEEWFKNWH